MNNQDHLKIPYSQYTDTLESNVSKILELIDKRYSEKKPVVAIYGMGANGIYLTHMLSQKDCVESIICVDRQISINLNGFLTLKPNELIKRNDIDLLILTTSPQHYKQIDRTVCCKLDETDVLYVFDHFIDTADTDCPNIEQRAYSQMAAIKAAMDAGRYFSANLLIRSGLQLQPADSGLLELKALLSEIVTQKDLDDDELIGNVQSPNNIVIQLIDNCNLKCYMCFRQNGSYAPHHYFQKPISREMFERLLAGVDFSNVGTVCLGGSGEAFLHPDILFFLDYIIERETRVLFITNGSLLNSKIAEELAKRSGYDLQLSLDAFTPDIYNSIRVGADFEAVIKKFTYFMKCIEKHNSDINLSIASVLMHRSIEDMPKIVNFAAESGIPAITGNNIVMTGYAGEHPEESLVFHPKLFNQIRSESLELAREKGITLNLPEPFPLEKKAVDRIDSNGGARHWDTCHEPWTRLDMRTGAFSICCGGHPGIPFRHEFMEAPYAEPFSLEYMTGYKIMNELFNGKILRTLRKQLLTNRPSKYCRNCFQQSNNLHNFNFHSAFSKDLLSPEIYRRAKEAFMKKFQGTEYLEMML